MRRFTSLVAMAALLGCGTSGGGGGKKKGDATSSGDEGGLVFPDVAEAPDAIVEEDTFVPVPEDTANPPPDEGTPPPPDDGPPPPPDVVVVPDQGPPKTDLGDPTGPVTGGVLVAQVEVPNLEVGNLAVKLRWGAAPTAPVVQDFGACKVVYSNGDPAAVPPDPAPGLDGGVMTITGLNQPMVLSPKDMGPQQGFVYDAGLSKDNKSILGGGPSVAVQASGGAHVPAWTATVNMPAPVKIGSPGSGFGDSIDKGKSLTVTWNASGGTQVNIYLFGADTGGAVAGNTITCTIDGDPGSFTVPSGAMKMLPGDSPPFPGFPGDYIAFGVTRIVTSSVNVPGGTASLSVTRTSGGAAAID